MIGELANNAFNEMMPATAGDNARTRTAISTSAVNIDMSGYKGHIIKLQAVGADAYYCFTTTSGDTTVTSSAGADQGVKITDGQTHQGYAPYGYNYVKVIGSASGSLIHWNSSKRAPTG